MNWRTDLYSSFVNLDHRRDRLEHMTRELARVGLTAERTRGRLPIEFGGPEFEVMRRRTPGAIGCHMSQVQVCRDALAVGKHAFVMEDDLIFCSDIQERLDYISGWATTHEWDIVWLGASFHVPPFWHPKGPSKMKPNCSANLGRDCETTDDPRMIRTYGAFCTFAYIVNIESIPRLMDLLDGCLHESIGIDWAMIRLQPQLKCFSFVPGCVKQMDGQSNIGTGKTIWSGFLKLNGTYENSAYVWQDKIEMFDPTKFSWK